MSLGHARDAARVLRAVPALWTAARARRYARRSGLDMSFADFGVRLGGTLLSHGDRNGFGLLVCPVNIVRYWELPFVWDHIPPGDRFLDVSSPRLLSLRFAATHPEARVILTNPDSTDGATTSRMARALSLDNLTVRNLAVNQLAEGEFDAVWSISVVEHTDDDTATMRSLFDAVRPGGRLIVTVPVDRHHRDEYRDHDAYGLHAGDGPFFFQRFYTEETVRTRLVAPLGVEPARVGYFGERRPGTFVPYEQRWIAEGLAATADDPRRIVDEYATFRTWGEMPGIGVCGLVLERRA